MQGKSEGSISYERETPALAADVADGRQLPDMGLGTKNIEARGVEGTKDVLEGLADQDIKGEKGKASWTADMRLADRIDLSSADELAGYIPDFTYKMVRVHEYGNEDLKKKHNEMSLVMMINRIQSPEDYTEFLKSSREYVDEIYNGTSEDIRKVYQEVLWSLLQKMNVPVKEAREKLAEMEEKGVGTLFADMEKMDIQEERRKTKEAREEADAVKKALEQSNRELEELKRQTGQKLEDLKQQTGRAMEELKRQSSARMNAVFSKLVSLCQGEELSREETVTCLQERYGLGAEDAVSAVEQFWNH